MDTLHEDTEKLPLLFVAARRSRFHDGHPFSHHQPHRLGPQHPHPPNQAKHLGPVCGHWQPGRHLRRSVAGNSKSHSCHRLGLFLLNVALCSGRFGLLQQTQHADRTCALHAADGLPVTASSISAARSLPVVAARCCDRGWMAATRTKPRPAAKAQPESRPHATHVAPEPTKLQCQLLRYGRGLAQCGGQGPSRRG